MFLKTVLSAFPSPSTILLIIFIATIGYYQVNKYIERRRIISLGGYAAQHTLGPPIGRGFYLVWRALRGLATYSLLELHEECLASAGSYTAEVSLGLNRLIWTSDAENIKAMLATQFDEFGKGEEFSRTFADFLGKSIFSTDGAQWKHSRALLRPQFIKDRFSDLEIFEHHVAILLEKLEEREFVDPTDLFLRYCDDVCNLADAILIG